jgi:hypothetical protein
VRAGLAAVLWLMVGVAIWNGFYDLYVSRGAREYLQMAAEAELGRRDTPSMTAVMTAAHQNGARASTYWALFVVGSAWMTIWFIRRSAASTDARQGPAR